MNISDNNILRFQFLIENIFLPKIKTNQFFPISKAVAYIKNISNKRMTDHEWQINSNFGAFRMEKGEVDQDNQRP